MAVASAVFAIALIGPYGIAGAGAGWLIAQTLGAIVVGADILWRKYAGGPGTLAVRPGVAGKSPVAGDS